MRVPLDWLREFVTTEADAETIARALTARGLTVDAVIAQPRPERIIVGRIARLERHPNADKLQVGHVDVGGRELQIVTGADNVAVGDKVPIAVVGATVYAHGAANGAQQTKTIAASALRGVPSEGMMCSADELALPGDNADGIFIMDDAAQVGEDFWRAARFGDATLDIDVPSNRADCLSVIGIAREAAAALGAPFREPDYADSHGTKTPPIGVEIGDPAVCRRLIGQFFWGVRQGRAPTWMALRLQAAGVRSIDLLVDISNYVQLETGQPLHFYDAARLRGPAIVARSSKPGEKVVTLDGVERELEPGTPVIADGRGIVGVAGIFGGAESGVTAATRDLFVESPNFVGARVRRASIALGLRTEGSARHERALPLELPEIGRRAAAALLAVAGGEPSAVVDVGERPGPAHRIPVRTARVNALLGTALSAEQMSAALTPLEFQTAYEGPTSVGPTTGPGGTASPLPTTGPEAATSPEATSPAVATGLMTVAVPYFRGDVREEVDVIEEIARAVGFDRIDERRAVASVQRVDESLFRRETQLAREFAALGYHECVHIALLGSRAVARWERSGIPFWSDAVSVLNPLSEDQRLLRPSLLPSLLATASNWVRRRDLPVRLFEIGNIFRQPRPPERDGEHVRERGPESGAYGENGVTEWPSLCGVACFEDAVGDGLERHALAVKGQLEHALRGYGLDGLTTVAAPRSYLHPGVSADLTRDGETIAKFGRVHPALALAYELPAATYAFFLYLETLPRERPTPRYRPLPRFPSIVRDLAVVVADDVAAGDVVAALRAAAVPELASVRAFDEYRGAQVSAGKKSIALRLELRRADGTLTDAHADQSVAVALAALRSRFNAVLRT